jgi:hypothetical protein
MGPNMNARAARWIDTYPQPGSLMTSMSTLLQDSMGIDVVVR